MNRDEFKSPSDRGAVDPLGRFEPTHHATTTEIAGETVLLSLKDGTYYGLDESGTFVWSLLKSGNQLTAVAAAMARRYSISEPEAAKDLEIFVADLLERELIRSIGYP
jgi:hypothetical protein